ncbi:TetR/AcrR family transcriptional regulator [Streptomyces sp. NPDC127020]|uniref:TetR/AcrR family transcriptional regulator n=1 Tax=Streptomyces sp. NPDC127020 TaxID=3347109 RepID=UPI00366A4A65
MGRVSRVQAEKNRERVVETASRLLREQGTQVSVAELMKAAGLTHGGFYKQFASKEALVDEAIAHAFAELARHHTATAGRHPDEPTSTRNAVIDTYLSPGHRDAPGAGCPVAALAVDMAREPGNEEAHRVYAEGVTRFAALLETAGKDGLTQLSTLVGALLLARATSGTALSDQLLSAARADLAGIGPGSGTASPTGQPGLGRSGTAAG